MSLRAETAWRSAYEVYAGWTWLIAALYSFQGAAKAAVPPDALCVGALAALALVVVRLLQALRIWRTRAALVGREIEWISTDEIQQKMHARPGHVWLGWGFEWTRVHAQRLYDLQKVDISRLRVPFMSVWRRLRNRTGPKKGNPHLHGIEPDEHDLYMPLSELQGHMFVAAITRAIKTRFLALLAVQAIRRTPHESVIIVDPKGDLQMRELIRAECAATGRVFAFFHPAFPQESVRIDTLATWDRPTEVASRIAALIPSETGNDPWSAFGWRVLNLVEEGYLYTHSARASLQTIRRYVEGGIDQLLHSALIKYFEDEGTDWREAIEPYLRNISRYSRPGATASHETVALVAYYQAERQGQRSVGTIDGLISMFQHNREHAQKMLASLIPILTMLTAGDLGPLLSPDRTDPTDTRPILTGASIADSGTVLYMGLNALSDAVVAYAITSIVMADLTAHAGARANLGIDAPRVNIFADEANEAVNIPFIQLLNKGGSAGYNVVFFSQTVPDFVAKLGSEARARQVLGNANSIVCGRTKDAVTAEYVMENFGKTIVGAVQEQQSTNTVAAGHVLNFSASYGERESETSSDIVPREALGTLPDLEFFGTFSGRPLLKGRIPLVRTSSATSGVARTR